jgi:hypothetical protein
MGCVVVLDSITRSNGILCDPGHIPMLHYYSVILQLLQCSVQRGWSVRRGKVVGGMLGRLILHPYTDDMA